VTKEYNYLSNNKDSSENSQHTSENKTLKGNLEKPVSSRNISETEN